MRIKIPDSLIEQGYISVQKHPECDYFIYNYTNKTVYENKWNEHTMTCRGLILNSQNVVIARPFMKFFNLKEYQKDSNYIEKIYNQPCEVYEKVDGSLGILYNLPGGEPRISTRGSFTSEQAIRATQILNNKYRDYNFDEEYTFMFEIVYPANRIVVDYADMEDLILLGAIHKETGEEAPFSVLQGYSLLMAIPLVESYSFSGVEEVLKFMKEQPQKNTEGFVLKFKDGLRVKVKYDEYCRLHKLITGLNKKDIWEILKQGQTLDELLGCIPFDFQEWVNKNAGQLQMEYAGLEYMCQTIISREIDKNYTDKEVAQFFIEKYKDLSPILFAMHKGKPYQQIIWKYIKPSNSKCYKCDGE